MISNRKEWPSATPYALLGRKNFSVRRDGFAAKQIVARVEELVKPLCEQAGVSLWDVEFEKEGGQYMLTVTVDRPEGVNIDQCEQVSRALDPMLDAKGI